MFAIGLIIATLSAASWAMGTILFEKIGHSMSAAAITFFKSLLSLLLMALLMTLSGWVLPSGRDLLLLATSGIVGISVGDTLFFNSLQCLGARMQVLYFILGQVVTIVLSFLILGEVLTPVQYIGSVVILSGVMLVIAGKQDDHPNKMRGVVEGLLAMVCYSISVIIIKQTVEHLSAVSVTFYRMLFSTLFVLVGGLLGGQMAKWAKPLKNKKTAALFLVNVTIVTYGGFLLSVLALKYIDVAIASVVATTETVFTFVFAYLVNGERPKRRELAGAAIAISGMLVMILVNGEW